MGLKSCLTCDLIIYMFQLSLGCSLRHSNIEIWEHELKPQSKHFWGTSPIQSRVICQWMWHMELHGRHHHSYLFRTQLTSLFFVHSHVHMWIGVWKAFVMWLYASLHLHFTWQWHAITRSALKIFFRVDTLLKNSRSKILTHQIVWNRMPFVPILWCITAKKLGAIKIIPSH